jgi:ribosome-associated protein
MGIDILVIDLRGLSDVSDFFVLCTGTSDLHVRSLSTEVVTALKGIKRPPWHVEGMAQRKWVLIDVVDIVVHVFRAETREYYSLERLWGDAPCTPISATDTPASPASSSWTPQTALK